ncbi:MAG: YbhB/YbcL family Raf kinase inhibitor-like protein [bacterium]
MQITSPAFRNGQPIPLEHTCKGRDASPEISWTGLPDGTGAVALILDDPDAPGGTWTHWTLWDLPPTVMSLAAGADVTRLGAVLGTTSARTQGYHGPCPPSGTHRYFFTIYALDGMLGLPRGAKVDELRAAIKGRALGKGQLMGTFSKA